MSTSWMVKRLWH